MQVRVDETHDHRSSRWAQGDHVVRAHHGRAKEQRHDNDDERASEPRTAKAKHGHATLLGGGGQRGLLIAPRCTRPLTLRVMPAKNSPAHEWSSVAPGPILDCVKDVADNTENPETHDAPSEAEKRDNVIRLAFGGNAEEFEAFCRMLDEFAPPARSASCVGAPSPAPLEGRGAV